MVSIVHIACSGTTALRLSRLWRLCLQALFESLLNCERLAGTTFIRGVYLLNSDHSRGLAFHLANRFKAKRDARWCE